MGNGRRPGVLGICAGGWAAGADDTEDDGMDCKGAVGIGGIVGSGSVASISTSTSCDEMPEPLEPLALKSSFGKGGSSDERRVSGRPIVAAGEGGGRVNVVDIAAGAGDASTKLVVNLGTFTVDGMTSVSYAGITLARLGDRPVIPEERLERALLVPPTLILRGDKGLVVAYTLALGGTSISGGSTVAGCKTASTLSSSHCRFSSRYCSRCSYDHT